VPGGVPPRAVRGGAGQQPAAQEKHRHRAPEQKNTITHRQELGASGAMRRVSVGGEGEDVLRVGVGGGEDYASIREAVANAKDGQVD